MTKEFVEGESLFDRPVAAMVFTRGEILEIGEDGSTIAATSDADDEG